MNTTIPKIALGAWSWGAGCECVLRTIKMQKGEKN